MDWQRFCRVRGQIVRSFQAVVHWKTTSVGCTLYSEGEPPSEIQGHSNERQVDGITFWVIGTSTGEEQIELLRRLLDAGGKLVVRNPPEIGFGKEAFIISAQALENDDLITADGLTGALLGIGGLHYRSRRRALRLQDACADLDFDGIYSSEMWQKAVACGGL